MNQQGCIKISIDIDLSKHSVRVTDNGCGMGLDELRQFLKPNLSFKSGPVTRGSKGVGATYLGYGFNSLQVITRRGNKSYSGIIQNGRCIIRIVLTGNIKIDTYFKGFA
ncbi:MAG: ATP-binding protein, partial [Pedobacter sp.]